MGGNFTTIGGEVRPYFAQFDAQAPSVVSIVRDGPATTNALIVQYTVTFDLNVTGVDSSDFVLTTGGAIAGASVTSVTGSGSVYSVSVSTGTGEGTIRLDLSDNDSIVANAFGSLPLGGAGTGNGSFTSGEVYAIDKTPPTVSMSSPTPSPTNANPIPVTVTFSKPVTSFSVYSIVTTNATATNFAGSGTSYSFDLVPAVVQGTVTADIPQGVAFDGASNGNTAAPQFSRVYKAPPTIEISAPSSLFTTTGPVAYTVAYLGADTVTLALSNITLNATGTATGTVSLSGTGSLRTVTISAISGNGTLGISIAAGTASDTLGGLARSAGPSTTFTIGSAAPTVTLVTPTSEPTSASPLPVTASFSEFVTGFTSGDVSVTNGTVVNFSGAGASYSFDVIPRGLGSITIRVPGGAAVNLAGSANSPSPVLTRTYVPDAAPASAQRKTPRAATWVTNGPVYAIATTPSTTYIGGQFTYVGPNTGGAAVLDRTTGALVGAFPAVGGDVYACVSDGAAGWFIGGFFTSIGGVQRNNIAHILANGSLDLAWNPNAEGITSTQIDAPGVYALAVAGGLLYVGGAFSSIGGQTRYGIAALDVATGLATPWNPNAWTQYYPTIPPVVVGLAVSGNTVYAGGLFNSIGGRVRNDIAALDATTGLANEWNPNVGGALPYVMTVVETGNTIYIGGSFSSAGGQSRNNIAALDATTGLATSWNPNANNQVNAIAVSGGVVYVGGSFSSIGIPYMYAPPSARLAAIDAATGFATAWAPNPSGRVQTLLVSGSSVFVGGSFNTIAGQTRSHLAELDVTTGVATAWAPNADGTVNVMALSGSTVFTGGLFSSVGGVQRNCIAALDNATGAATAWNPTADSQVSSLAVVDNVVYAGGNFSTIGGQSRLYLAAIDSASALPTSWSSTVDSPVVSLSATSSVVYAAGDFTTAGGQPRNHLAALDAATGLATAWAPEPDASVYALAASGSVLYAGGLFSTIGGQTRNKIAALDTATGLATAWNPDASAPFSGVYALTIPGATVYAGGSFTVLSGQNRSLIAEITKDTGLVTAWDPNATGPASYPPNVAVTGLTSRGGIVFAAGNFTAIGGQFRNGLAAIDTATGLATSWNPNASGGSINILGASNDTVFVGGAFTAINGQPQPYFAQFDSQPAVASVTRMGASITNAATVQYSVTFTEAVSGVDVSDFALTTSGGISGASVTSVSGSGADYVVTVSTGAGDGAFFLYVVDNDTIVSVTDSVALGGPGANTGNYFSRDTYTIDKTPPVANIGAPSASITAHGPVSYTVSYTGADSVTLDPSKVILNTVGTANATISVTGTGNLTRTVTLSNISGDGALSVYLAANTASDAAGNTSAAVGPSAAFAVDNTSPSITVSGPSQAVTRGGPVTYSVTFGGQSSVPFDTAYITLNKTGSANGLIGLSGADGAWTVTVSSVTGDGTLGISIAAGAAVDSEGNLSPASGASVPFIADNSGPSVTLVSPTLDPTTVNPIPVIVAFSEPVTGFTSGHVVVTNASLTNFAGSGAVFSFDLVPGASGAVTASIASGMAFDTVGNPNQAGGFARNYNPKPQTGSVSGVVQDFVTGGRLGCAAIHLFSKALGVDRVVVVDLNGEFRALNLPVGDYSVEAYATGYDDIVLTAKVTQGNERIVNFGMHVPLGVQRVFAAS